MRMTNERPKTMPGLSRRVALSFGLTAAIVHCGTCAPDGRGDQGCRRPIGHDFNRQLERQRRAAQRRIGTPCSAAMQGIWPRPAGAASFHSRRRSNHCRNGGTFDAVGAPMRRSRLDRAAFEEE
jgi:hypothetical protein